MTAPHLNLIVDRFAIGASLPSPEISNRKQQQRDSVTFKLESITCKMALEARNVSLVFPIRLPSSVSIGRLILLLMEDLHRLWLHGHGLSFSTLSKKGRYLFTACKFSPGEIGLLLVCAISMIKFHLEWEL